MTDGIERKQETTVRDFLNVVFRRKWMILGIVFATSAFVGYLKISQPLGYSAASRILVKRGERQNIFTGSVRYLTWAEEVSSQLEVILSEAVFTRARQIFADSVKARGLPPVLAFNPGAVRADVVGESNVFAIRYSGYDPDECVLGCIAVTEGYAEYYSQRSAPPVVTEYFSKEIEEALSELEYWQREKSKFLDKYDYLGEREERGLHLRKLTILETELAEINSDLASQTLRVQTLERLIDMPLDDLESQLAMGGRQHDLQTAIMSDIKRAIRELRMERETMQHKYTERHPDIISIDRQISDLQKELKREVDNSYQVELGGYNELMAQKVSLETEAAKSHAELDGIPEKERGLSRIENEIQSHQQAYTLLIKRRGEAEIGLASAAEWEVTILSAATRAWPQKRQDYLRIVLGPFLSLVVAMGIAFFFESLDHSVKNAAEVEEYLGTKVLTTIVEFKK